MFMRVSAYQKPKCCEDDDHDVPSDNTRRRKISNMSQRTAVSRSSAITTSTRSTYRDDFDGYRGDDGKSPRSGSFLKLFKGHFKSSSSVESTDSSGSGSGNGKKTKKWHYSIENFEGPKAVDDRTRYLPHQAVWAQAYAFGGR